jgi:hypothetical protein
VFYFTREEEQNISMAAVQLLFLPPLLDYKVITGPEISPGFFLSFLAEY